MVRSAYRPAVPRRGGAARAYQIFGLAVSWTDFMKMVAHGTAGAGGDAADHPPAIPKARRQLSQARYSASSTLMLHIAQSAANATTCIPWGAATKSQWAVSPRNCIMPPLKR